MTNGAHGPWKGEKDDDLFKAIDNAWKQAKKDGAEPGRYKVQEITFEGTNPIHSYIVTIVPDGG